ncbi:MAG: hypothetical protein RLP44_00195 [Aggregatilineales bacterium]
MTELSLINASSDAAMAERINQSVAKAGHTVHKTVLAGRKSVSIFVFSEAAKADATFQEALYAVLDNHQHIIPVLAKQVALPRLIDHLQPLDFSKGYDEQALLVEINLLSAPNTPPPATVLTPTKQKSNQRFGLIFAGIGFIVFLISLYAIGVEGLRAPENEFASVETQIILTRNYYIDNALPHSTEEAANFQTTFEYMPTTVHVELEMTATAIAGGVIGTFVPQSTVQATNFPETLEAVSTVVHDSLLATVTAAAGE